MNGLEPGGAQLLDAVAAFLRRFVAFPQPEQVTAVSLWVMHTHALDAFETTPRLSVQSPEKQSGKTRLLEVLDFLCRNPMRVSSASTAALFREIEQHQPTVLFDEVDAIFGPGSFYEDLRSMVNAGQLIVERDAEFSQFGSELSYAGRFFHVVLQRRHLPEPRDARAMPMNRPAP